MCLRAIPWAVAASLLLGASHGALPCSLGDRQLTVPLEPGSAALGAGNARALAEWLIQWRDGGGIASLLVVAPTLKADEKLAHQRLLGVAHLLDGLNTGKAPIAYEVELRGDGFPDRGYLNSLDMNVRPACIESGTCCRTYGENGIAGPGRID